MTNIVGEHTVSAAEISRNFGLWQDKALSAPVIVTNHGRSRVVLISADQYDSWMNDGAVVNDERKAADFESSLSAALDHISEAFVAFDADLKITTVNRALEMIAVRSASKILGRSWEELFPAPVRTVVGEQLKRVLRTGEAADFDAATEGPAARSYEIRAFPYPGGAAALIRNRTGELEQAAAVQEARSLSAALSVLPQVIVIKLNVRGVICELGPDFAQLLGFAPDELHATRLTDILLPRERRAVTAAMEAVLQGGEPQRLTTALLHKDSDERQVNIGIAPTYRDLIPDGILAAITPA